MLTLLFYYLKLVQTAVVLLLWAAVLLLSCESTLLCLQTLS